MADENVPGRASRTIRLPEELARAIEARIQGSSFDSVDAFVAFVLARLLEERGDPAFSEEDERQLKERLRSLGYID
jgi:Arc/MetJ-type ribon-helix-helix transcriptional regulator